MVTLAPWIPRGLAYFLGTSSGDLVFFLWRNGRRAMIENMTRVLGRGREAEAEKVARRSMHNYFRYLMDLARLQHATAADVERRVVSDQWYLVDEAFARGKGVLLALMHFGMWDMG